MIPTHSQGVRSIHTKFIILAGLLVPAMVAATTIKLTNSAQANDIASPATSSNSEKPKKEADKAEKKGCCCDKAAKKEAEKPVKKGCCCSK